MQAQTRRYKYLSPRKRQSIHAWLETYTFRVHLSSDETPNIPIFQQTTGPPQIQMKYSIHTFLDADKLHCTSHQNIGYADTDQLASSCGPTLHSNLEKDER